ncbi:MAG: hypothetical protein ACR2PQ_02060, partial [Myxococcota bacterium]
MLLAFQASSALVEAETVAHEALREQAFAKLVSVAHTKRLAVEGHVGSLSDQISRFASEARLVSGTTAFKTGFPRYFQELAQDLEEPEAELAEARDELGAYYRDVWSPGYLERAGFEAEIGPAAL